MAHRFGHSTRFADGLIAVDEQRELGPDGVPDPARPNVGNADDTWDGRGFRRGCGR